MIPFLSYLLKANIVLLLLYGFYFLCLRRDTFYGTIRWYLLAVLAAAVLFPLVNVSGWLAERPVAVEVAQYVPTVETVYQVYQYVIEPQQVEYAATEVAAPEKLPVGLIIFWCWFPVAVFLLAKRLLQLVSLAFLYFRSQKQLVGTHVIVVVTRNIQPFSFAGRIFLNPLLYTDEELNEIITHEWVHCRQIHSLDILFAELIVCLCWLNPAAWLLRNAIRQNLEYYTDRSVLRTGLDRKHYQYSLLRVSGNTYQIVNHFHINHFKKRIIMMNKKNSSRFMAVKYLLVVPALMAVLLVVQMSGLQAAEEYLPKDITNTIVENVTDLKVHISGSSSAVSSGKADKYIIKKVQEVSNMNGKMLAKEVTGSITVKNEFVPDSTIVTQHLNIQKSEIVSDYRIRQGVPLTRNGENDLTIYHKSKIKYQAPEIIFVNGRPVDFDGAASGRMVSSLFIQKEDTSFYKDGYIMIRMSKEGDNIQGMAIPVKFSDQDPLLVVNGFSVKSVKNLRSEDIENIRVLKNNEATAIYGDKGKHGVVIIETKDKKMPPTSYIHKEDSIFYKDGYFIRASLGRDGKIQEVLSKKKPLLLIDERKAKSTAGLSYDMINSIRLIYDVQKATTLYGNKAKNGVVVVTTKGKK